MELSLVVVGGYMATVLAVGWLRGWHGRTAGINTYAPKPQPRRQVVRIKGGFQVVG